jgi:hypothetical protein
MCIYAQVQWRTNVNHLVILVQFMQMERLGRYVTKLIYHPPGSRGVSILKATVLFIVSFARKHLKIHVVYAWPLPSFYLSKGPLRVDLLRSRG